MRESNVELIGNIIENKYRSIYKDGKNNHIEKIEWLDNEGKEYISFYGIHLSAMVLLDLYENDIDTDFFYWNK